MRYWRMVRTSDGVLHETVQDAKKHAERRYGDLLLNISRQLTYCKYTSISEFIDANLSQFAELQALKDDIELDGSND